MHAFLWFYVFHKLYPGQLSLSVHIDILFVITAL